MPKGKKGLIRLGDSAGGLLGGAIKALKTGGTPSGQKKKKKKTRQQILDSIF